MPLPAKELTTVLQFNRHQQEQYFFTHARYFKEAPQTAKYAIRVGSKSFFSHDTMELRRQFDKYLAANRAQETRQRTARKHRRKP